MIKLIAGEKGSGKTKKMIDMANEMVENTLGNVVFIDVNNKNMYNLKHHIRFVNIKEYDINDIKNLVSFISGIMCRDHDIDSIFIDGLLKIKSIEMDNILDNMDNIKSLSEKFKTNFVLSLSCNENDLPESLKELGI
ncbi:MAG: twitching motility protein PilT [Anaeromicrobium sp.]|jgi:DNA polymerase III delta prime subunit|uniref:twitching motility protein PilT n=1 Tax=Anaeromicrobium sp. TaxID=1929132 RepID=UPI0025EDD536|nr:twitching motility protein PilT [Anaeromicrobium sp.]MCT4595996.1 twitching motility protein PilT [Anaeromicrobium sp.]